MSRYTGTYFLKRERERDRERGERERGRERERVCAEHTTARVRIGRVYLGSVIAQKCTPSKFMANYDNDLNRVWPETLCTPCIKVRRQLNKLRSSFSAQGPLAGLSPFADAIWRNRICSYRCTHTTHTHEHATHVNAGSSSQQEGTGKSAGISMCKHEVSSYNGKQIRACNTAHKHQHIFTHTRTQHAARIDATKYPEKTF